MGDTLREMYLKALFVAYMLQYVGTPYKWGGNNPIEGMDCSGFAQVALRPWGLDPAGDQTAQQLHDYFVNYEHGYAKAKPVIGALVFFGKTEQDITHVGVSIGHGFMVEARGGGRSVTTPETASDRNAFVQISPILHRRDLVAVVLPKRLPWAVPDSQLLGSLIGKN